MLKAACGWAIGFAAAGIGLAAATWIDRTGAQKIAAFVIFGIAGAAGVAVGAFLSSIWDTSCPRSRIRLRVVAWAAAFGLSFLLFAFWQPIAELARRPAQAGDVNDVRIHVFDPYTSPSLSTSSHGTGVDLSETQIGVLVCIPLFGFLGGLLADVGSADRSVLSYMRSLVVAVRWAGGVFVGGIVAFIGFYLLAGLLGQLIKPLVLVAVVVASAVSGFFGGMTAAMVAIPFQRFTRA